MQYISKAQASLLYENVENILRTQGLTEKERIPKYRTSLESLFRELTSDEKRYLDSLHGRIVFITTEYNTQSDIKDLAHHLRIFGNKLVHESKFPAGPADDARCLYALATVIAHFSQTEIPELIRKSFEAYQSGFAAVLELPKQRLPTHSFRAIVRDIYVPDANQTRKHCSVVCDTDELGTITIKFWDNKKEDGFGSDLSNVHEFLQPYCNLYITEVRPNTNREGEYSATDKTLLVFEPDYLLEAKELAECCQMQGDNPLIHLLNRFSKGAITDKMMVGIISGQMLDDLATEPKYDYLASFEKVMRVNSFGILCMAHQEGQYRREAIKKVYETGAQLEPTIRYALESFGNKLLVIEPTFISDKFGLQGRLDVLLEDPSDVQHKDIVEMKSGSFHKTTLYPNHEAQALVYSLMLESTFPGRRGLSAILYAKATPSEKPLRSVREDSHLRKQQLLLLRNRIVANELSLAAGDTDVFNKINPETFGPAPQFQTAEVASFYQTIQSLTPLMRDWFFGFTQFVFAEMQTAKTGNPNNPDDTGGFSALWRATANEKTDPDNYNTLTNLRLIQIADDFHLTLQSNTDLFNRGVTNFRDGEVAILYPTPDPENPKPLEQQILKCTILSMTPDRMVVSLANKQLDKSYLNRHKVWAIERDFRESGYRTMLNQLYRFLQAAPIRQERILGLKKPEFKVLEEHASKDSVSNNLNGNQMSIVQRALSAKDYFLIQGPPGTGKTSTILRELVRKMAAEGLNVMIIAFTNQAVKVICEKLSDLNIDFIRLGRGEEAYCWQNLSNKLKLNELYDKVSNTRVFVSTQATFANSLDLLHFKKFHTLVIDEASQLLEPQLVGILPHFERFLMIGDDNQLPAVVLQSEEYTRAEAPELKEIGLFNFRESLFSRLLYNAKTRGWQDCYGILEYHYRMHADIAEFPNKHFYANMLRTGKVNQESPLVWQNQDNPFHALFTQRVSFVSTRREISPKVNEEEATLVANLIAYVHQLYGDRFDPTITVGVITPFRAQIAKIRQMLPAAYQRVTIDTVERFQGSERDVIIVSFALKNALQLRAIQSINADGVDRKLNVMLTRAKDHLVLLGSESILRASPIFTKLLDSIASIKVSPIAE